MPSRCPILACLTGNQVRMYITRIQNRLETACSLKYDDVAHDARIRIVHAHVERCSRSPRRGWSGVVHQRRYHPALDMGGTSVSTTPTETDSDRLPGSVLLSSVCTSERASTQARRPRNTSRSGF